MNQPVTLEDLEIGGHTDVGRRKHNEDAFVINTELGLVVVADGVGGHQSGEVASGLTCDVLQREIDHGNDLAEAINRANAEVLDGVQTGKGKAGMGSTVVAALMSGNSCELAWVGDSRAYLWDGKLSLLTRDHSLVEAQLASGQISPEEARNHPRRNVILQAVGLQEEGTLDIGINHVKLAPGSCLLLCSDGITDPLDNEQICQLLSRGKNAQETCERMVNTALQCGGKDNATALLVVHNGPVDNPSGVSEPAEVVWVYNPDTGQCEGRPDVTLRYRDAQLTAEKTQVQRVKPGAAAAAQPGENESGGSMGKGRRPGAWRYFWVVALLGAIVLGLVYLLR